MRDARGAERLGIGEGPGGRQTTTRGAKWHEVYGDTRRRADGGHVRTPLGCPPQRSRLGGTVSGFGDKEGWVRKWKTGGPRLLRPSRVRAWISIRPWESLHGSLPTINVSRRRNSPNTLASIVGLKLAKGLGLTPGGSDERTVRGYPDVLMDGFRGLTRRSCSSAGDVELRSAVTHLGGGRPDAAKSNGLTFCQLHMADAPNDPARRESEMRGIFADHASGRMNASLLGVAGRHIEETPLVSAPQHG
jgi:hypothetical protein